MRNKICVTNTLHIYDILLILIGSTEMNVILIHCTLINLSHTTLMVMYHHPQQIAWHPIKYACKSYRWIYRTASLQCKSCSIIIKSSAIALYLLEFSLYSSDWNGCVYLRETILKKKTYEFLLSASLSPILVLSLFPTLRLLKRA